MLKSNNCSDWEPLKVRLNQNKVKKNVKKKTPGLERRKLITHYSLSRSPRLILCDFKPGTLSGPLADLGQRWNGVDPISGGSE